MNATIFTDGSSRGNPGPGGWAFIFSDGTNVLEKGGREDHTTNNRMEIMGALKALQFVQTMKEQPSVTIYTDSAYLINGITKWLSGWQKNNWQTKTKEAVKNEDLWRELSEVIKGLSIKWMRVSGHVGVPGNERGDEIATMFADGETPQLFNGTYSAYGKDLTKTKGSVSKTKKKSSKQGVAYSYVSKVNGKIMVHKTWSECEARVKGVSAARFKKAISKQDEEDIVNEFSS